MSRLTEWIEGAEYCIAGLPGNECAVPVHAQRTALAALKVLVAACEKTAIWTQDLQDRVERDDAGIVMWRGCVADSTAALESARLICCGEETK